MGNNSTVDKTTALQIVLRRLQKMQDGERLTLLTWKKDRSVCLTPRGNGDIEVYESGFVEQTTIVPLSKLRKLLKTLLKREFPRSHKIRLRVE